jgi:hypothetical protein
VKCYMGFESFVNLGTKFCERILSKYKIAVTNPKVRLIDSSFDGKKHVGHP